MASDTYYAWSPILYGAEVDKDGNRLGEKAVEAGDKVTKSQLGVDDVNFQALIESGAIRNYAYPDMPPEYSGSPVDFLRQQADAVAGAVEGSGGGYFGPSYEEALTDPASVGVVVKEETEEEK